jgi:RNA polymerase sigma factor (TIGR02999 family)
LSLPENARRGGQSAANAQFAVVYDRLRRLAARYLGGERSGHTLQATALVREAYLRLASQPDLPTRPGEVFGRAAHAMRRVLVDHARRRRAVKRGAGVRACRLEDADAVYADGDSFVVALDEALERLAAIDPEQARIVELRFFGGLTIEEASQALGISARSVNREWVIAKGWLHRELSAPERQP